ncbi:MAG: Stk1 family PASTA domain-containing Ser/Thr kinase [Bacillota bacterium]
MIGKIFNNRYEIKEQIGSGGTAVVYKGRDNLLVRMVTVKVMREEYNSDEAFVRRFRREAEAVASLSHGNIVAVYDVGYEDNMHYIVMEFVEGESLKDYIKSMGTLSVNDSVNIMCQMLEGIGYAHEHGIIHRDIKSHNILLSVDGRVKVTDFGIAVGISDVTQTYTSSSKIMGSVQYISPEQVQGGNITEKSDIYSAGVVFYEMLTGQLPFNGDSPINVAMQHVQGEIIPPHHINLDVPVGLSYVVMRAMRKNPEIRYNSAFEMENAIRAAVEGLNSVYQNYDDEEATKEIHTEDVSMLHDDLPARNGSYKSPIRKKLPKPFRNKNKRTILILSAILLAAVVFLLVQVGVLSFSNEEIVVPDLYDVPIEEAESQLKELKLKFSVTEAYDDEIEEGHVISQSIPAGQTVKKKRTIELVVSQGARKVDVPNVVGDFMQDAENILRDAFFDVEIQEEYNSQVSEGRVIRQSPSDGEQAPEGSTVVITVSKGVKPAIITMPTLTNRTLAEAKKIIDDNMLTLGKARTKESFEYDQGIVFEQSIAAGTEVEQGATIDLVVSDGPGKIAKTTVVTCSIPDDDMDHNVKILVTDVTGTNEVYNRNHPPGTTMSYQVTYYNSAKIKIYLDGVQVEFKNVS